MILFVEFLFHSVSISLPNKVVDFQFTNIIIQIMFY